jgi:uncharacterized pyridoxal phosphate-containing UPF0001 family protein
VTLADRLTDAQQRIAAAASVAKRDPESIQLIVVTKNHPTQLVFDLLELGARHQ